MIRFIIPSHSLSLEGTYQAFAHLFVGGLVGAWLTTKKEFYLILFTALIFIEIVAFFVARI